MMGVNSPHYVGSTWPSNRGSYNWDAELLSSWNAGLSSTFSRWGNTGCGSWASHLGVAVVLKRELQTLCQGSCLRRGSWALRLCAAVVLKHELQTLCWASRVRRELQALCLSTEVVLRLGLWFLHLGIAVVLRRGLRALRLSSARVALIIVAPKAWTLLSDDLSSVIFRQSTVTYCGNFIIVLICLNV